MEGAEANINRKNKKARGKEIVQANVSAKCSLKTNRAKINKRPIAELKERNLLYYNQYDFRKKLSTIDAI